MFTILEILQISEWDLIFRFDFLKQMEYSKTICCDRKNYLEQQRVGEVNIITRILENPILCYYNFPPNLII